MLSNDFYKRLTIFLFLFILVSCSDKQEKIPVINYENKSEIIDAVKKYYNKETQVAVGGLFDETGKQFIATGLEINNTDEWGIKFEFIEQSGNEFKAIYQTEIVDGSFKESFFDKIKFSSIDYDLVYYNSQSYFMGSGGGEVFSYIVDLENKQVYYAHLVVESQNSIYLFISDNTQNKELINFFTLNFKKDYPALKIVKDDIVVE